jgi:hypothetical protein
MAAELKIRLKPRLALEQANRIWRNLIHSRLEGVIANNRSR